MRKLILNIVKLNIPEFNIDTSAAISDALTLANEPIKHDTRSINPHDLSDALFIDNPKGKCDFLHFSLSCSL